MVSVAIQMYRVNLYSPPQKREIKWYLNSYMVLAESGEEAVANLRLLRPAAFINAEVRDVVGVGNVASVGAMRVYAPPAWG